MTETDFPKVQAGEWVQPTRRGYLTKCCDCGLVHKLNFRLRRFTKDGKHKIQMQAFRWEEEDEPD